jgi:AcrR family transcriptional regulator
MESNARERILQAAVKIFAIKSFEGSRIDEIAREAKVPKSLIYYHFKSKDEILEILSNNFINEYISIIQTNLNEPHQDKADALLDRMKNIYYEFGKKNEDLIRVMLIDSLKKNKEKPILFQVIEAMIAKEAEFVQYNDYDLQERRIVEFFTSFIPNYAYICFADSWIQYFYIEKNQFDHLYLKIYSETHGAYHKNHAK